MITNNKKELHLFLTKITVLLAIFVSSFFLKKYQIYSNILRSICIIVLSLKPLDQLLRNIVHKRYLTEEFFLVFASFINICLGNLEEIIIFLFIYNLFDYTRKSKIKEKNKRYQIQKKKIIKTVKIEDIKIGDILILEANQPNILRGKLISDKVEMIKAGKTILCKPNDTIDVGMYSKEESIKVKVLEKYKNSEIYNYHLKKGEWKESQKEETRKKIIFNRIVFITSLFFIFIPNLITGEIQREIIHFGILLLFIGNLSKYSESLDKKDELFFKELYKNNINIKDYTKLSKVSQIKNIIFEKTGTLTTEELRITEIKSEDNDNDKLLKYLYYAEYNSNHSIANLIKKHKKIKIDETKIKKYQEYPSRGIECRVDKDTITVGNAYFLKDKKIDFEKCLTIGTVIYIAVNKEYLGYIVISDAIKRKNKVAITELKNMGIKNLFTLSGDNEKIVSAISKELGITDKYSNLTTDEKIFWTKHLKEYNPGVTAIVGNINTSKELLNLADVSIILLKGKTECDFGDIKIRGENLEVLTNTIKLISDYENKKHKFKRVFIYLKGLWIILSICGMLPLWVPFLLEEIFCILETKKEENYD